MYANTSKSSDNSHSTQTRVRRSKVWEYFEQNLVEADDGFKVVCKYCEIHLSTKSGTSSLRTHISHHCHAIGEVDRKRFVATLKKPIENFVFDPQLCRQRMIIHEGIKKIRELLKHIDSSPSRIQAFNQIAMVNGLPTKRGIALDIPNRWNSTFKMVREALTIKVVLNSYANQNAEIAPNEQEWTRADSICGFLETFEEATKAVSADRKPTSHMFLPLILSIKDALDNPEWQTSAVLEELAAAMKIKFEKYWGSDIDYPNQHNAQKKKKDYDINLGIVIATLLDPRGKGEYVEFFYQKICRNTDQIRTCVNVVLLWMKKYYVEYEQHLRRVDAYSMAYSSEASSSVGSPVLTK